MASARDSLKHYRQKRDFTKTPEPTGIQEKTTGRRYLIQKHAATRLHYDFRLELDGVLKSWAVTRGPSLDPQDKRLAVEVEDHPVSYGSFEGTIPKGQYGGGTVMLWDEGSWEPIGDPHEGLKKGKLEFLLHGKRLHGEWTLVRMRSREKDKGRNNWLLIKHRDAEARHGNDNQLLAENTTSIVSDRSMEEIAFGDSVWQSHKKAASSASTKKAARRTGSNTSLPGFIPPQLATLSDEMPGGKGWVHEVKFDGYRALAYIAGKKIRIFTRTGQDWTPKFRSLVKLLEQLPVDTAILDGEIVAPDEYGNSSFRMLQDALSEEHGNHLQYYVFDLLHLDGNVLTRLPLLERKKHLHALLKKSIADRIIYSEHYINQNKSFLQKLCRMKMEGVISKRGDAPYISGRGRSWLKTKCHTRQEFVIGGFTEPTHAIRGIGALLIGYYDNDQLLYAGKVGTGFDQAISQQLRRRLDALIQKDMAFSTAPADGKRGAKWVKPQLVCEIEFTEWTAEGRLRHPSFQGLREDKPSSSVHRDAPVHPSPGRNNPSKTQGVLVGNTRISHPDRIIYPGTTITKLQLAEYYQSVADRMLPYLANRPLSMVRCPEGTSEPCFFQRHLARNQSPHLYDAEVEVKGRREAYLKIKDKEGLLSLIQWGVIELHPWGCLADTPDKPDIMIFDLDPDPDLAWEHVIKGALEIRERLQEFGMESFLKTTGGKGLHVVVPMMRDYRWNTIKTFAKAIAQSMEHDQPKRYTATISKAQRKGKIFVDYLRNELTATAIAPLSARARTAATVAMPLAWEQLKPSLNPGQFTIETVPQWLQRIKKDPWGHFLRTRQKLSPAHLRALKITPE